MMNFGEFSYHKEIRIIKIIKMLYNNKAHVFMKINIKMVWSLQSKHSRTPVIQTQFIWILEICSRLELKNPEYSYAKYYFVLT